MAAALSPASSPASSTDLLSALPAAAVAEEAWRRCLAQNPNDHVALNNLANLCKENGRPDEAQALYRQAIASRPGNFEALNNLGNLLKAAGRPADAEDCLRQALACQPGHPDIRNNLGVLLHEQGRFAAAEVHFRAVLLEQPEHLESLNNLGNLLKDLRRLDEAEACYRRLLAQHPAHPEARWNLGLLRLLRGDPLAGWPLYEARHDPARQQREVQAPRLPTPAWDGQPLAGRHLLVWPEQGHGDEIQFARYLPYLKEEFGAGRVTVVCKPALCAVLATVAGVDAVLPAGAGVPAHDCWILCGSLPWRFAASRRALPDRLPYLAVPPAWRTRWQGQLPTNRRLRIGLAWAGSRLHKNDRHRSLPTPDLLAPLWQVPDIDFFGMQTEAGAPWPAALPLIDCGGQLADFADSAALLGELDLLITVDSALAHLAGALARPCWVLLPYLGIDWRWGEAAAHSAWYPGALRLFRQSAPASWPAVITEVAAALAAWAATARQRQTVLHHLAAADRQRLEHTVDRLLTAGQVAFTNGQPVAEK